MLLCSCHGCGLLVTGYGRLCFVPDNRFAILHWLCGVYLQQSYLSCCNHVITLEQRIKLKRCHKADCQLSVVTGIYQCPQYRRFHCIFNHMAHHLLMTTGIRFHTYLSYILRKRQNSWQMFVLGKPLVLIGMYCIAMMNRYLWSIRWLQEMMLLAGSRDSEGTEEAKKA